MIPPALAERKAELARLIDAAASDARHFALRARHWTRQATLARAELSGINQAIAVYAKPVPRFGYDCQDETAQPATE